MCGNSRGLQRGAKTCAQPAPTVRHGPTVLRSDKLRRHQGTAAMIESKLEFAMQTHTQNLASAVEALDTCLERNQGLDLLGVAMADCIEAIKGAALHADAREELAKLLEKAAEELGSGVVSRRGADLIALLGDCGIQEPKLESAIKAAWVAAYEE
ncbi:unnamed protein product [Effrenium voratum]|uniref:Uncharacterized protein n=1 Tax=Effrenium voratum TaxID=2562239 RepID=A0AA36HV79_9DINO|nr:unnamed protein product [Effrenium voratum]